MFIPEVEKEIHYRYPEIIAIHNLNTHASVLKQFVKLHIHVQELPMQIHVTVNTTMLTSVHVLYLEPPVVDQTQIATTTD